MHCHLLISPGNFYDKVKYFKQRIIFYQRIINESLFEGSSLFHGCCLSVLPPGGEEAGHNGKRRPPQFEHVGPDPQSQYVVLKGENQNP